MPDIAVIINLSNDGEAQSSITIEKGAKDVPAVELRPLVESALAEAEAAVNA